MPILYLKLALTPALIGAVSLAGRWWGPAVSGWLTALPLTSGPVALYLALERGEPFAALASVGTLGGTASVVLYSLAYALVARRFPWSASVAVAVLTFTATTALMRNIPMAPWPAFWAVLGVISLSLWVAPRYSGLPPTATPGPWDIPARMILATTFVVAITGFSELLGPLLSGLLSPLPIFITILAVFTHRTEGGARAADLMRGVVAGSYSFAVFFLITALLLEDLGWPLAFLIATLASLSVQAASGPLLRRA
ncbi:MAG: hypothetical protein U0821_27160 [Chloroflexota bacterium]